MVLGSFKGCGRGWWSPRKCQLVKRPLQCSPDSVEPGILFFLAIVEGEMYDAPSPLSTSTRLPAPVQGLGFSCPELSQLGQDLSCLGDISGHISPGVPHLPLLALLPTLQPASTETGQAGPNSLSPTGWSWIRLRLSLSGNSKGFAWSQEGRREAGLQTGGRALL